MKQYLQLMMAYTKVIEQAQALYLFSVIKCALIWLQVSLW